MADWYNELPLIFEESRDAKGGPVWFRYVACGHWGWILVGKAAWAQPSESDFTVMTKGRL